MKIALGTAQFGIDYGIANKSGQVNFLEAKSIVNYASSIGIDTIDTAIAYGSSQKCLGKIGIKHQQIYTKLPKIPGYQSNLKEWVNDHVQESIEILKVKKLSGLLLHRPSQLLDVDKKDLWKILNDLKTKGLVRKIGFSIYTPDELEVLYSSFKPDIVQAPFNLLDRRLKESGWLEKLYDANIEIHIRSIFLQGLLLMSDNERPKKFDKWRAVWAKLENWTKENNTSKIEAALSFAFSDNRVSRIVIGVDSLNQLKDIVAKCQITTDFPNSIKIEDSRILDPSKWDLI